VPAAPGTVAWFGCCIGTPEVSVMRQTAILFPETAYVFIPRSVWDAFWIMTVHSETVYRDVFCVLYGLKTVEVMVDDSPLEAIVIEDGWLDFWVGATVFYLSPAGTCLDGCQQSRLPTP